MAAPLLLTRRLALSTSFGSVLPREYAALSGDADAVFPNSGFSIWEASSKHHSRNPSQSCSQR